MNKTLFIILAVFYTLQANAYVKCDLYSPYRCVPTYGNKVVCGCGL